MDSLLAQLQTNLLAELDRFMMQARTELTRTKQALQASHDAQLAQVHAQRAALDEEIKAMHKIKLDHESHVELNVGGEHFDTSLTTLWSGLFEATNPILIKAALVMCGMIPTDHLRLPLVSATAGERGRLAALLDDHGITGGS